MDTYSLQYADDGVGVAKRVEFEAYDASTALLIAQREAAGRAAELWQGKRKLCTLTRVAGRAGEIWQVSPAASARA